MQNNEQENSEQDNLNGQESQNKFPDGRETDSTPRFERRTSRGKGSRWQNMFEPRPFSEKSSAQDNLMLALKNRNLAAFEQALADPDVDPDHWYGKPYWSTVLQLAAQTEGCESFVSALLKAGAGSPRGSRGSAFAIKPLAADAGDMHFTDPEAGGQGDAPSHVCVCGAQTSSNPAMPTVSGGGAGGGKTSGGASGQTPAAAVGAGAPGPEVAVDAASLEAAAGAASGGAAGHRLSFSSPRASWVQPMGQDADQQNIRYWLRDLGRAVREMSQYVGGEIHTLSEHMEVLEERVAAVERSQQKANEHLRQLLARRGDGNR